jgi:hypothetical protein
MIRVLQVFPVPPTQIPKVNMRWLLDVAKSLALDANPQIRPRMEQPCHVPEHTTRCGRVCRPQFRFKIKGFDVDAAVVSRAWTVRITITIGTVSAETSLPPIPHGDRIDWMTGVPSGGGGVILATEHPSDPEYRLAQIATARYTGSFGNRETVRYKCKLFLSLYSSHTGPGYHGQRVYRGSPIWYVSIYTI